MPNVGRAHSLFGKHWLLLPFFMLVVNPPGTYSQASLNANESRTWTDTRLLAPNRKVEFERIVFEDSATAIPYWKDGSLIVHRIETDSSGAPNVSLYTKEGKLSRQANVWFPDAYRLFIADVAVGQASELFVSGTVDRSDGARAAYIARMNSSGSVESAIQTKDFYPAEICTTGDGTVWSFGDVNSSADVGEKREGYLLRQFDFKKGQIAAYLRRSEFAGKFGPAIYAGPLREVYLHCSEDRIYIYSGPSRSYVEIYPAGDQVRRWTVAFDKYHLPKQGFAMVRSHTMYAVLRDDREISKDAIGGLFRLEAPANSLTAHWVPVLGTTTTGPVSRVQDGVPVRLLGADGDDLIYSEKSGNTLLWSTPLVSPADGKAGSLNPN